MRSHNESLKYKNDALQNVNQSKIHVTPSGTAFGLVKSVLPRSLEDQNVEAEIIQTLKVVQDNHSFWLSCHTDNDQFK